MRNDPAAHLLFDLDGTLSDPREGITRSLNHALTRLGLAPRPEADLLIHIGPPLDEAFRALTGLSSPEEIAPFVAAYRERYVSVGYRENRLYPGVIAALTDLRAGGFRLGVCTSKRTDIAEQVLAAFDLRDFFGFVDGGEIGTPKTRQIERLKAKGWVDEATIMIGDRAVDITAAHNNGLRAAGVLWGYGSRQELESVAPEFLLHEPGEWTTLSRFCAAPSARKTSLP